MSPPTVLANSKLGSELTHAELSGLYERLMRKKGLGKLSKLEIRQLEVVSGRLAGLEQRAHNKVMRKIQKRRRRLHR